MRTPENQNNQHFVEPIDISTINPSYPVIIITHGWTDSGRASWIQNLTNAYFEHGKYNIIAVNWQKPANEDYATSVKNINCVGKVYKVINSYYSLQNLLFFKEISLEMQ